MKRKKKKKRRRRFGCGIKRAENHCGDAATTTTSVSLIPSLGTRRSAAVSENERGRPKKEMRKMRERKKWKEEENKSSPTIQNDSDPFILRGRCDCSSTLFEGKRAFSPIKKYGNSS
jgi:hypothetical protein